MSAPIRNPLLHWVAIGILLLGCGSGGYLFWTGVTRDAAAANASPEEGMSNVYPTLSLEDSKRDSYEVERMSGKAGLLLAKIQETFQKWKEPKPLGITIIVVSLLTAWGLSALARSDAGAHESKSQAP